MKDKENSTETALNDAKDRAREVLRACAQTRKRVETFLAMSPEEQKAQDQNTVRRDFSHLFNCVNRLEFIAVTGSTAGAGQCTEMWKRIKKNLDRYCAKEHTLIYDHMVSIENPELWKDMQKAREREAAGIKPNFLERLENRMLAWLFTEPKKAYKEKDGQRDKPANP